MKAKDIKQYYLRSDAGKMIPLDNLVQVEQTANPQVISHFNLFRSAEIAGSAAPGVSSGQAIQEMEQIAARALPQGFGYAVFGRVVEGMDTVLRISKSPTATVEQHQNVPQRPILIESVSLKPVK